jgi:signal transduction histidine kinase
MHRILIAEDSLTQAELLRAALENHGFGVTSARDGKEALRLFEAGSFDLVISDVVMPGMSGYELCRAVKSVKAERNIPVILLTSLNEPMDVISGLECGADNFLTKPYKADDLIKRVQRILDNQRLRGSGRVSVGVEIMFLGNRFTITSDKEQILDLLISTFEDTVRANQELQRSKADLAAAKTKIQSYASDLEVRVRERTADLARTNVELQAQIAARQQTEEQLLHAQKMDAIGNLTGGMAHDFNNLLSVVIGNLDLLMDRQRAANAPDELGEELVSEALNAAMRGGELVRRLLAFSRKLPLQPRLMDIGQIASELDPLLRRTLGEQVQVRTVVSDGLWPVMADPSQVENAILNLCINARDAMPGGGTVTVACANVAMDHVGPELGDLKPGDYVSITVADTGAGIPPDVLARVFEPFFTTKEVGKGNGLGLSMVYGFAHQSGGTATIYSEVGYGTEVRIYLPRGTGAVGEELSARRAQTTEMGHGERILVVEDRPDVRRTAVFTLESLGYKPVDVESAEAALAALDGGERFDVLFSDIVMPGRMNGIDLAHEVRQRFPGVTIVFASGFSNPETTISQLATVGATVIGKPYSKADLGRHMHAALVAARGA